MREARDWNMSRADKEFSIYIRKRDGRCMNPLCPGRVYGVENLECSHYYSRGIMISRFDPENCIALCHWCHMAWENTKQAKYKEVMIQWLGKAKFAALQRRVEKFKFKCIPFMSQDFAIKKCREFLQNYAKEKNN